MKIPAFISQHKSEILSAVIGALLMGVVSLMTGLYSLTKSFEFAQNKEFLASLRSDITLLKKVENMLDENLNLLLNHDYRATIEGEQVPFPPTEEPTNKEGEMDKEEVEMMMALFGGGVYKITVFKMPREPFALRAWEWGGPAVSDIDFGLTQEIDDLLFNLYRVNGIIRDRDHFEVGSTIPKTGFLSISRDFGVINRIIGNVTQQRMVELKNRVTKEMLRLREERRKIRER